MASPRHVNLARDVVMTTLAFAALAETAWTIYLGWRLPRHYTANHWDSAWVGLDAAQVVMLLGCAWAAWRRRAVVIFFANAAGTLLLVDAWFDVMTARYRDFELSALALIIEIPWALFLFWIAWYAFRRLSAAVVTTTRVRVMRVQIPPPRNADLS